MYAHVHVVVTSLCPSLFAKPPRVPPQAPQIHWAGLSRGLVGGLDGEGEAGQLLETVAVDLRVQEAIRAKHQGLSLCGICETGAGHVFCRMAVQDPRVGSSLGCGRRMRIRIAHH